MSLRSVLTIEWVMAVQDAIRALAQGENIDLQGGLVRGPGDGKVSIGTRREKRRSRGGGGGGGSCAFGEIIPIPDSDPPVTGIRGGVVFCGDQTWNLDPQPLNLEVVGSWLVSLEVEVEVNRDDDGEIILPGLKTGTRPDGDWEKTVWTEGTDYPPNDAPEAATGTGTIHVPLGKLTIVGGAATFERVGCGNITLGQCAGTLTHSRG